MQGRERFFVRAADTNTKENAMQAVLDFINNHVRDIFIPLTALALLRVGMCLAQLKRMTHLREKKGAYHAVRGHYEELGVWFGALAGLLLRTAQCPAQQAPYRQDGRQHTATHSPAPAERYTAAKRNVSY